MRRLCLFIAIICFALRGFAQDVSTGAVRGMVVDPSGNRIANASIVVLNDATGVHYEHFSDGQGRFAFELLPPGDYSARATAEGMSPQVSPGVRVGLSVGVRYDLQTFSRKYLKTNPLWPDSGKVPLDLNNFAPRAGVSYAFGEQGPLVARVAYGMFYPRIPQIYNSAIETDNGLAANSIFLNQTNYYDRQIFPQYPYTLVQCAPLAASCTPPANLMQFAESEISAFAHNFRTPKVHQASLTLEHEVANRVVAQISYSFVHGQNLIRARDVNLPNPTAVQYPIFDASGLNVLGYGAVETFSTWQFSSSLTCPFPPCINPLARPIPQLGSINVFESAASSVYHGATLSIKRQMMHGL